MSESTQKILAVTFAACLVCWTLIGALIGLRIFSILIEVDKTMSIGREALERSSRTYSQPPQPGPYGY